MKFLEKRSYVGPNLYANFPVIRYVLDIGTLENHPSAEIDGFVDGLVEPLTSICIFRSTFPSYMELRQLTCISSTHQGSDSGGK